MIGRADPDVATAGPTAAARILTEAGEIAASGFAAEADGVFTFDRIRTDAAHRRLGLGTALMSALLSTRRSDAARLVLVATDDGRSLYRTLGWRDYAPYVTALIPAPG